MAHGQHSELLSVLCEALETGCSQVAASLEMLTGQPTDKQDIRISAKTGEALQRQEDFGFGPLATVTCSVHGDVEGEFLLVQRQADFEAMSNVMAPQLDTMKPRNEPVNNQPPDWMSSSREATLPENLNTQMKDVLSEAGNMLFGLFLTALSAKHKLATYQGVPSATVLDYQQLVFQEALSRNRKESNVAAVIEINSVITGRSFSTWLLFMPHSSGVEAILDQCDRYRRQQSVTETRLLSGHHAKIFQYPEEPERRKLAESRRRKSITLCA